MCVSFMSPATLEYSQVVGIEIEELILSCCGHFSRDSTLTDAHRDHGQ